MHKWMGGGGGQPLSQTMAPLFIVYNPAHYANDYSYWLMLYVSYHGKLSKG